MPITREHIVPMKVLESKLFPIIERDDLVQADQVLIQWGDMALIGNKKNHYSISSLRFIIVQTSPEITKNHSTG